MITETGPSAALDRAMNLAVELAEVGDDPEHLYVAVKHALRRLSGKPARPDWDARTRLLSTMYGPDDSATWSNYITKSGTDQIELFYGRLLDAERKFLATGAYYCDPTDLYYWRDADDLLIYVGITGNLAKRQDAHGAGSTWTQFAASCTVEKVQNRGVALVHEKCAIRRLKPLFNKQHNDTPEAREALVKYLAGHRRWDLLAPAIKRG